MRSTCLSATAGAGHVGPILGDLGVGAGLIQKDEGLALTGSRAFSARFYDTSKLFGQLAYFGLVGRFNGDAYQRLGA